MAQAAPYVIPAIISYLSTRETNVATGKAADVTADAMTRSANLSAQTSRNQLAATTRAAQQLRADTAIDRRGNYDQWWADTQNVSNLGWDTAQNARVAGNILGKNTYNRYWDTEENRRQELLARGRTDYGRDVATQQRLGRLGALVGAPQPAGGRRMGQLFEPGALVQTPWVDVPEGQRTALVQAPFVPLGPALPPATVETGAGGGTGSIDPWEDETPEERARRRRRERKEDEAERRS